MADAEQQNIQVLRKAMSRWRRPKRNKQRSLAMMSKLSKTSMVKRANSKRQRMTVGHFWVKIDVRIIR